MKVHGRGPMPTKVQVYTQIASVIGLPVVVPARILPTAWQAQLGIGAVNRYGDRRSARHAARRHHRQMGKRVRHA
jgi:hypothetical protein